MVARCVRSISIIRFRPSMESQKYFITRLRMQLCPRISLNMIAHLCGIQ